MFSQRIERTAHRSRHCDGAQDTVNDLQTTIGRDFEAGAVTSATRQLSSRASLIGTHLRTLIRQPTARLLLPALRNSLMLVASSSRQDNDVMVVSSGSTRILIE